MYLFTLSLYPSLPPEICLFLFVFLVFCSPAVNFKTNFVCILDSTLLRSIKPAAVHILLIPVRFAFNVH